MGVFMSRLIIVFVGVALLNNVYAFSAYKIKGKKKSTKKVYAKIADMERFTCPKSIQIRAIKGAKGFIKMMKGPIFHSLGVLKVPNPKQGEVIWECRYKNYEVALDGFLFITKATAQCTPRGRHLDCWKDKDMP
jgi:hypothetical protein